MLRAGEWESCSVPLMWVEFTADIIQHRVREVTKGTRHSVTLFTPSHLDRLSQEDWMNLEPFGFPVEKYSERDVVMSSALKRQATPELGATALGQASDALVTHVP